MPVSKLYLVLRLTNEEERRAALMFKAVQDDYTAAENALNQALTYRFEYEEMSRGVEPSTFALIKLRAARSFLANIDSLVENQRIILRAKYEALEAQRERWQLLRAQRRSVEAVIASRSKLSSLSNEKKEQRLLDDLFVRGGSR